MNKYHDYFSSPYSSKLRSNDSGYYDGTRLGKENYKSKYNPEDLYSEASSASNSSRSRPLKTYSRNDSSKEHKNTAINLFDIEADNRQKNRAHRNYGSRKQHQAFPKSKTQQFFESEDAFSPVPDEELTERENKRKEIQGLIMKYAQLDDFYAKTTAKEQSPSPERKLDTNKNDLNNNLYHDDYTYAMALQASEQFSSGLQKSQTSVNVPRQMKFVKSPSNHHLQSALVPIIMPGQAYPVHRQRNRPKQPLLSTFVRQFFSFASFLYIEIMLFSLTNYSLLTCLMSFGLLYCTKINIFEWDYFFPEHVLNYVHFYSF